MSSNRSVVWMQFVPSADGSTAKCKICSKDLKWSGANTTNLMLHLERQHRREHQDLKEEEQRRKMQTQAMNEVCLLNDFCIMYSKVNTSQCDRCRPLLYRRQRRPNN